MRTNWKLKISMSIEQLQNVFKRLEKNLEHFFNSRIENYSKANSNKISQEFHLVFYTRKWIWRTLKFYTTKKSGKCKCTYSLRFICQKNLSAYYLNDFFLRELLIHELVWSIFFFPKHNSFFCYLRSNRQLL